MAAFRAWFEAFDAARFDEKIARDAARGKLDRLVDKALADHRRAAPASCEAFAALPLPEGEIETAEPSG